MMHREHQGFPVIKVLGHIVNHMAWKDGAIILTVSSQDAIETIAAWMIANSFATGHGDTLQDLLDELSGQIRELRDEAERRRVHLETANLMWSEASIREGNLLNEIAELRGRAVPKEPSRLINFND